MDVGLLPVKSLSAAKSRLAPDFDAPARRAIAEALFEDALELCTHADAVTSWWIVTDDDDVAARAAERGLDIVRDSGSGLNEALRAAVPVLERAGATGIAIISADVPLARPSDVVDLVDTGATSDVVVVPSGDDAGTNALYLSTPDAIDPRFGPSSLTAHLAIAQERGLRCAILALPRLALDIDSAKDIEAFLERPEAAETHTGRALAALGV
ncbi:MAG TPA: 2-phospho-L-lactate guanylyltransferase [Actinomycetota bacterium]|nr:2-phospho-L-lactate guanylyltransferase [Actinomycetota bacterium]